MIFSGEIYSVLPSERIRPGKFIRKFSRGRTSRNFENELFIYIFLFDFLNNS